MINVSLVGINATSPICGGTAMESAIRDGITRGYLVTSGFDHPLYDATTLGKKCTLGSNIWKWILWRF